MTVVILLWYKFLSSVLKLHLEQLSISRYNIH